MQDGYTQVGAGQSDMRVSGNDLQHHRQPLKNERSTNQRMVTQPSESGGPMKQHMKDRLDESLASKHGSEKKHHQSMSDRRHESEGMTHHYAPKSDLHHHLEMERSRHEQAKGHSHEHMKRHHSR